jgi:hypothetical protein
MKEWVVIGVGGARWVSLAREAYQLAQQGRP